MNSPGKKHLPIEQPRQPEQPRCGRNRTPERIAVENTLREHATRDYPLTAADVAARNGITELQARTLIYNTVNSGRAYPVYPGRRPAVYAWGQPPVDLGAVRERFVQAGLYDGRELLPFTARRGAMAAFALPSLQGGTSVERRLPVSLASREFKG